MKTSHGQILRATSLLGGAGMANILISLVRNKFVAVLLGPSGLGLVGLLLSLVQAAAALGGMGISNAAVREIAAKRATGDARDLAAVRSAIRWGTWLAAFIAAGVLFLCRVPIATHVLARPDLTGMVGWMAPAVALSIISASQVAVLTGFGEVKAVAGASVLGAALSTGAGIGVLLVWGEGALLAYTLTVPMGAALSVALLVRRVPKTIPVPLRSALGQTRWLVAVGAPMMLGAFVTLGSQFALRAIVGAETNLHQLGLFQSALALSTTYVGVLLQSISSDFYPRLSGVILDRSSAIRLVNEQTETLLMLAGVLVLGLIAFAPVALHILYAGAFADASTAMRWLVLGNLIQIASWPMGFCLLAMARSRLYLLLELLAAGATIIVAWLLVPVVGMEGAAIAVATSAGFYLLVVGITVHRIGTASWRQETYILFSLLLGAAVLVFAVASASFLWGAIVGGLITLLWVAMAYRKLRAILADRVAA